MQYQIFIGTKHSAAWCKFNGKVYKDFKNARRASARIAANRNYWNFGTIWVVPVTVSEDSARGDK